MLPKKYNLCAGVIRHMGGATLLIYFSIVGYMLYVPFLIAGIKHCALQF